MLVLVAHVCGGVLLSPAIDPVPPPPRIDATWLARSAMELRAEMQSKSFVFVVGAHHSGWANYLFYN